SYASARLLATGKITPPARATLEGTKEASSASVETSAYESPSDRAPNARMKRKAIRRPRPVLMMAREMKNAQSTIQTMGSAYPLRASTGVMVPVSAIAQTPKRTMELAGAGRTMEPTIVAMKMARRRQEAAVIPVGAG